MAYRVAYAERVDAPRANRLLVRSSLSLRQPAKTKSRPSNARHSLRCGEDSRKASFFIGSDKPPLAERHSLEWSRCDALSLNRQSAEDFPSNRIQFLLGGDDANLIESHDLFCEMCELVTEESLAPHGKQSWASYSSSHANAPNNQFWAEYARWIKFEEDVEEGGERWSKPHVATLSLHSLFELRSCLLNGVMLLDCDATTMEQLVELILTKWVVSKKLPKEKCEQIRAILLLRCVHLKERLHKQSGVMPIIRSLADIAGRKHSAAHSTATRSEHEGAVMGQHSRMSVSSELDKTADLTQRRYRSSGSLAQTSLQHADVHGEHHQHSETDSHASFSHAYVESCNRTHPAAAARSISIVTSASGGNNEQLCHVAFTQADQNPESDDVSQSHAYYDSHLMKKIPSGSEVANVLVGEVDGFGSPLVAFVRLCKPCLLGDMSEVPLPNRFIFVLLGPTENESKHREIGRSIGTLLTDSVFRDIAYRAQSREDLLIAVDEFLSNVIVLPPGEWDPTIRIEPPQNVPSQESRKLGSTFIANSRTRHENKRKASAPPPALALNPAFVRTDRAFGGLINDLKARLPYYVSDFTDALHIQCIASSVFIYLAAIASLITFGGLLGEATKKYMATAECIVAAAICGTTYALFSGQPLTILSSTGPVLVFEQIVYDFAEGHQTDYLSFRCWIGMWSVLLLIMLVALDVSAYVRYITRFTEESFACLVSLIFIYEALRKTFDSRAGSTPQLAEVTNNLTTSVMFVKTDCSDKFQTAKVDSNTSEQGMQENFVNEAKEALVKIDDALSNDSFLNSNCLSTASVTPAPAGADAYYFSVLLVVASFLISWQLRSFRSSRFFPLKVRGTIADFAVVFAIAGLSIADQLIGTDTEKLHVPSSLQPTRANDRGWFVAIKVEPVWINFAAIPPAILLVILLFMDQQITAVIVNRKEHKLLKPCGYHLDLLVLSVLVGVCSVFGLPWLVASTVHSMNNVASLKKLSECNAPGEMPRFLGCREQRLTSLIIHIVIGLSIFLTSFLSKIPMPVLYGIFLYMGVSSLTGMEFVERCGILFMPSKYQPDTQLLRHVPLRRVHLFTFIQALCISGMWYIKTVKYLSIIFPLLVLALCFVRKAMDYIFMQTELQWLDNIIPTQPPNKKRSEDYLSPESESTILNIASQESDKTPAKQNVNGKCESKKAGGSRPVVTRTSSSDFYTINMTEEVAKTTIWQRLTGSSKRERVMSTGSVSSPTRNCSRQEHKTASADPPSPTSPDAFQKTSFMARILNYRRRSYAVDEAEQIELDKSYEESNHNCGSVVKEDKEHVLGVLRRKFAEFRMASHPPFNEMDSTAPEKNNFAAQKSAKAKKMTLSTASTPAIVVDPPSGDASGTLLEDEKNCAGADQSC